MKSPAITAALTLSLTGQYERQGIEAAEGMSAMGAVYRHTTTAMEARILRALDTRLAEAVAVVEASG